MHQDSAASPDRDLAIRNRGLRNRVLLILLVLAVYVGSFVYNYSERERRSLRLQEEVQDCDQVHASVRIVEANPTASEITARLSFRLAGRIAKDAVTASADLRVLVNSARGPQEFNFPKGRRINPILAVFILGQAMSTGIQSTGSAPTYGSL